MSIGLTTSSASTLSSASSSGTRRAGWRRTSARMRRAASRGAAASGALMAVDRLGVLDREGGQQLEPHRVLEADHRAGRLEVEIVGDDRHPVRGVRREAASKSGVRRHRRPEDLDLGDRSLLVALGEHDVARPPGSAARGRRDRARRRAARTAPADRARRSAPARPGPRGSGASCREPGRSTSAGWWLCLMVMTRRPRRASSLASATVSVVFPAFFRPMMERMRVDATVRPRARDRPRC